MKDGREVAVFTKSPFKSGLAVLVSHSVAAKVVRFFTLFVVMLQKGYFL